MKFIRTHLIQTVSLLLIQTITLVIIAFSLEGLIIESIASAVIFSIVYPLIQTAFWIIFIQYLAWLPGFLYPIFTFMLSGIFVVVFGNWIPGVVIDGWGTGFWITFWLTSVNAVLGGIFSLDEDANFDRNITLRLVKRRATITQTEIPGFLFLEIDGLGEQMLHEAIQKGRMPTLKGWIDRKTHKITGWETDFTSQTGAMQTGILLGNNSEIPAYRWWDRQSRKIVMSGDPRDAVEIEKARSSNQGLLSNGGASRGNMFSGDAKESLLTMSTVLVRDQARGPGFYFYLFNPYIAARLVTRFLCECIKEWWQAWQQKRRHDPYRVGSRRPAYALLRSFMGPLLQDLATFMVINDVLRGLSAIYALYAGYDDLAHFAGQHSEEAFDALQEVDHYFARIEKVLQYAPRPYHIIVLSDHGQTQGRTFENTYQISLEVLVEALMRREGDVYAAQKTHETWDKLSVLLLEATLENTRTASILKTMLGSRYKGETVQVGPQSDNEKARAKEVVVVSSGCAGLIYFSQAENRLTYEDIQERHPELVLGLVKHPGIGFVLVKSEIKGDIVIGKKGIHYLVDGKVEGDDPLAPFGPNAALLLQREASFSNCPDILVNTDYNPQTQEMCGFEDQASHHGGLGGPQNQAFVMHPVSLDPGDEPIVTAEELYRVMHSWRNQIQTSPLVQQSGDPL